LPPPKNRATGISDTPMNLGRMTLGILYVSCES